LVFSINAISQQNNTFEFKGEKRTLSTIMEPSDKRNGFKAEFFYDYCFVNCGAWKIPVLYFNRLPKYNVLGYYRNSKFYSINDNDATLVRLIKSVDFNGAIYNDVKVEISQGAVREAIYTVKNVLSGASSANVGCFDANTVVWFDEKDKTDKRKYVNAYYCRIFDYNLSYSFLEGPCKELNTYIDKKAIELPALKKKLAEAENNKINIDQLYIANQIKAIDPNDDANNRTINFLQSNIAQKEKLIKKLEQTQKTDLKALLEIRYQIASVDRNDSENKNSIQFLEEAIKNKEAYTNNKALADVNKSSKSYSSSPTTNTYTYIPPQKHTNKKWMIYPGKWPLVCMKFLKIEPMKN